jgi:hypothetical protein
VEVDRLEIPLVAVLRPDDVEVDRLLIPLDVDVDRLLMLLVAVLRPLEVEVDKLEMLLVAVLRPSKSTTAHAAEVELRPGSRYRWSPCSSPTMSRSTAAIDAACGVLKPDEVEVEMPLSSQCSDRSTSKSTSCSCCYWSSSDRTCRRQAEIPLVAVLRPDDVEVDRLRYCC